MAAPSGWEEVIGFINETCDALRVHGAEFLRARGATRPACNTVSNAFVDTPSDRHILLQKRLLSPECREPGAVVGNRFFDQPVGEAKGGDLPVTAGIAFAAVS